MVIKNHLFDNNSLKFNIFVIILGNFQNSHENLFRKNKLYKEIFFNYKNMDFDEIILGDEG